MSEKNRKPEIKEGGAYLGLPLCSPAAAGRPSQEVAQPTRLPLLCRLPSRQGNGVWPARARHRATPPPSLPACPPLAALDGPNVATQPPRSFSPPSRSPSSLVLSSPSAPERSRRHRSPLPWPPASPRLPDMLPSSATTPSTFSSSHEPPSSLHSPPAGPSSLHLPPLSPPSTRRRPAPPRSAFLLRPTIFSLLESPLLLPPPCYILI